MDLRGITLLVLVIAGAGFAVWWLALLMSTLVMEWGRLRRPPAWRGPSHLRRLWRTDFLVFAVLAPLVAWPSWAVGYGGGCGGGSPEAALASNLATIRQAIEMYKVQHADRLPSADIVRELTTTTDVHGGVEGTRLYGPYLRNGFPRNPVTDVTRVRVLGRMPDAPGREQGGWIYCLETGAFKADTTGAGPSGVPYFDL